MLGQDVSPGLLNSNYQADIHTSGMIGGLVNTDGSAVCNVREDI